MLVQPLTPGFVPGATMSIPQNQLLRKEPVPSEIGPLRPLSTQVHIPAFLPVRLARRARELWAPHAGRTWGLGGQVCRDP